MGKTGGQQKIMIIEIHLNSNPYSYAEPWARLRLSSILGFKLWGTVNMINICVQSLALLSTATTSKPRFKTYFGWPVQKTGLSMVEMHIIPRIILPVPVIHVLTCYPRFFRLPTSPIWRLFWNIYRSLWRPMLSVCHVPCLSHEGGSIFPGINR